MGVKLDTDKPLRHFLSDLIRQNLQADFCNVTFTVYVYYFDWCSMKRNNFKLNDNGAEPTAAVSAGNHSLAPDKTRPSIPPYSVFPVLDVLIPVDEIAEPTCIHWDE